MTGSASRTGTGRSCARRSPARPSTTGRRRDRGPGSRGRACTGPAPRGRSRRAARRLAGQGRGPAARAGNARDAEEPEVLDGADRADDVRAQLVRQAVLGAFRRSRTATTFVTPAVRGPRIGWDGERDEPLAAQSPLVGRRQAPSPAASALTPVMVSRAGHRSGSRPRPEPGLLVLAHEVAAEVRALRPRARVRRFRRRGLVTVIAAAGREADHERGQRHCPRTRACSRRTPETFRGSLMSEASAGTSACTMGAQGPTR